MLKLIKSATIAGTMALAAGAAFAQDYPSKPIEVIVGYSAGGGTDVMARTAAPFIEKYLGDGSSLVVKNMPGASGIDVLDAIRDRPNLLPIVITGQGDTRLAVQAMKAGATDFLEKPCEPKALLQTIDLAFETLEETGQMLARSGEAREKVSRLSARERDVLEGLIEGKSNKVIGYELDISPRTVEVYRGKMMDKLEVQSLPEALRIAFSAGLIEA